MSKKKTMKYVVHKIASCSDCGFEWDFHRCEAAAARHTIETGHTTSLQILMDIARIEDVK